MTECRICDRVETVHQMMHNCRGTVILPSTAVDTDSDVSLQGTGWLCGWELVIERRRVL